jgi:hypothetical protein
MDSPRTRLASGRRHLTDSAAHTRPKAAHAQPRSSVLLQVQRPVHAADPDVMRLDEPPDPWASGAEVNEGRWGRSDSHIGPMKVGCNSAWLLDFAAAWPLRVAVAT